jgi:hypothetical protein
MKRIILTIFALSFILTGCEDIQDNSPAIQGEINNVFFKALDARGQQNDNGSFTLKGINQDQEVTLNFVNTEPGTYRLGPGRANSAFYEDANGNIYGTTPAGDGKIVITDHCSSCGTVSGNFNFVGINPGVDTIYMQKGIFFDVSYLTGGIDNDTSDGFMNAEVDSEPFQTEVVSAEEIGGAIVINGFVDNTNITVKIPANSASGNYPIGTPGYDASYTVGSVVEVAQSGTISVNFINSNLRKAKVFFDFTTENHVISNGDTEVDY